MDGNGQYWHNDVANGITRTLVENLTHNCERSY